MANLSKAVCHGESDKCRCGNPPQEPNFQRLGITPSERFADAGAALGAFNAAVAAKPSAKDVIEGLERSSCSRLSRRSQPSRTKSELRSGRGRLDRARRKPARGYADPRPVRYCEGQVVGRAHYRSHDQRHRSGLHRRRWAPAVLTGCDGRPLTTESLNFMYILTVTSCRPTD